jgi:hypothetical protein
MNLSSFIAIDIGATNVRVALTQSVESPSFTEIKNFELSHDFEKDFQKIIGVCKTLSNQKVSAIGIATPGRYNEDRSMLTAVVNMPEWVGQNIKERMETAISCPAFFENDAVASGLGQALYTKTLRDNFLFIVWGTGIGGSIVSLKPILKAEKMERTEYLAPMESAYGGKTILEKYGKAFSELDKGEQEKIITDFVLNLVKIANKFDVNEVVVGGGIGLAHGEQIIQAAENLLASNETNIQIAPQGDLFGLYGSCALIKLGLNI